MPKIKIKNLSAEINRRIRLIKTPTSVVDIGEQNGAVVETADYVGICLSPFNQPSISCEGSISSVDLFGFLPIDIPNGTPPLTYIDGVLIDPNNPPEWLKISDATSPDPAPPEGFYLIDRLKWTNTDTVNHTLEFVIQDEPNGRIRMIGTGVVEFVEWFKYGVCLAPQSSPVITCEGAPSEIYFPSFAGNWNIELDAVLYETQGASMGYFIRSTFSDILDCFDDGFMSVVNKDFLPHRIKFIPVQDTGYTAPENNPTFIAHPDGSLTFCLAEKGIPLGCEGATSVLNFERLTGGNYSFGAVDEENNRYEYVAGTVDDIRTWLDNNSFVELTLNNDGFGHFTYTGTTYKKFYIIMLNDGEMSIPTGNPTVTHIDGEQGYQWCAFASVEELKGWYTNIPINQFSGENIKFNITVDDRSWNGLNFTRAAGVPDGRWDNVPIVIGIAPEQDAVYIQSIGSLPIENVMISSPNIEFTQPQNGYNPPDASTVHVIGQGLGNQVQTSLLEYVGDEVTGDTVYLNGNWVTSVQSFMAGVAEYLQSQNNGLYHSAQGVGKGSPHATIADAVEYFQNTPFSFYDGQTLSEMTGLEFSESGNNTLAIRNMNLHEVTLSIQRMGGDFTGCINIESDSMESIRYRGDSLVMRLIVGT